jgi:hypothetical protein
MRSDQAGADGDGEYLGPTQEHGLVRRFDRIKRESTGHDLPDGRLGDYR